MAANLYSLLTADDADANAQAQALSAALRRRRAEGTIHAMLGDRVLAPVGAGMVESADAGEKLLSQAPLNRAHAKYYGAQTALDEQKIAEGVAKRRALVESAPQLRETLKYMSRGWAPNVNYEGMAPETAMQLLPTIEKAFGAHERAQDRQLTREQTQAYRDVMLAQRQNALDLRDSTPITTPDGKHYLLHRSTGTVTEIAPPGSTGSTGGAWQTSKLPSAGDVKGIEAYDDALGRVEEMKHAFGQRGLGTYPGASLLHGAASLVGQQDPRFAALKTLSGSHLLKGIKSDIGGRITNFEIAYGEHLFPTPDDRPEIANAKLAIIERMLRADRARAIDFLGKARKIQTSGIPAAPGASEAASAADPAATALDKAIAEGKVQLDNGVTPEQALESFRKAGLAPGASSTPAPSPPPSPAPRTVVRTGTNRKTGKKVYLYSDGTQEER